MRNIRLRVEYDGTPYAGWQRQPGGIVTVQGELEACLSRILQERVNLAAAGRTDRGVHALGQVVNFQTASSLELQRIAHSLNCLLPDTIRVDCPQEVDMEFHARFSAAERQYRYFLMEEPSAVFGRFAGCSSRPLDLPLMHSLAVTLKGIHDFSAFSREDRDGTGSLCSVRMAGWYRHRGFLVFHIAANRFLRSMVRGLVGAMMDIGAGRLDPCSFKAMLDADAHARRVRPAAASGLFLSRVVYPDDYGCRKLR
ncbi:MAG: tRNA pseudouridine(38,39,40) synthase TruA [Pelodictyon luteolum]|uniref:tRNA pseudouridine synthase A n=2 Tax=Pelodictyon luteolum TaxID=1100 RepID=TRUA_CHLL3|nr:tRNA pseudouridine(38-40) synthase TruA [Pelodictyon luteolum]Q3B3P4.1 RecName: Full=tRNA pseudouridine synthase A; AltName: Full=tRNA pseudouridine(38-40) synthase; AltName: Full=tRNA pseudouridylate synthase I; AltName: Full=tRNA-uridine isomerase I [Pelodictyon luteolum DSM 273]ABB24037.1 tRNA pseudouridine synthase [Pelodictyon luteolum DSM 273]KZK75252.1 MAG: tRNA pseudouridine(38,39,40) synthase TruA [Pelodictyon luteolum]